MFHGRRSWRGTHGSRRSRHAGCMRFTEYELTAALTGAAKSVVAASKKFRKGKVDIDTAW